MSLFATRTELFAVAGSTEQLVLSFPGASVFYHRQDGPYEIEWLRLTDASDNQPLALIEQAWTTSAYLHTEFQHTEIVIDESSYSDMPGPVGEDGKFISLDVSFNVTAELSGWYEVRGRLEDESGKTVARESRTVGLSGAQGSPDVVSVGLSFPGREISSSGIDGPYTLADITIMSFQGVVMDLNPSPYTTAPYSSGDFLGGSPSTGAIFQDGFESGANP
jgi:hypothetical protein